MQATPDVSGQGQWSDITHPVFVRCLCDEAGVDS